MSLTEGQRLDTVRTSSIQHHPKKLSEDIVTMAYGSFVAECVSEFLPEKQPEPHVYDLLRSVFSAFETRNPRIVALLGVYQLMEFTGLQLSYERCVRCGRGALLGLSCPGRDEFAAVSCGASAIHRRRAGL